MELCGGGGYKNPRIGYNYVLRWIAEDVGMLEF